MGRDGYVDFIVAASNHITQGKDIDENRKQSENNFFINEAFAGRKLRMCRARTLEMLNDEWRRFESAFSTKSNHILWAEDYEDVFNVLRQMFKECDIKSACFPQLSNVNAMNGEEIPLLYRELGLSFFLQDERIVLGEEGNVQFFHVDSVLADHGMLQLCNMSRKAVDMLNNDSINVFLVTLNQLLSNTACAELYGTLRHGDLIRGMYLYKGTSTCSNYLIVVDNGRMEVLRRQEIRLALTCIECGKCHAVCPVEQIAGKEAYNNVFSGPLACILLPYMEDERSDGFVVEACTMCGCCDEVCPLGLPLRDMIAFVRHDLYRREAMEKGGQRLTGNMSRFLQNRRAMNRGAFFKKIFFSKFASEDYKAHFALTPFAEKSYNANK